MKNRLRKGLSCLLTVALLSTTFLSVMPVVSAAEIDDPWDESASWPEINSISRLEKGQSYFTYKEWTGDKVSTDINGDPVRQADVFGVNREEAHASETLPYDSVDAAIKGAVDYDRDQSVYYKLLTGEGKDWQLTVYKNPTLAEQAGVTANFYKPDFETTPYTGTGVVEAFETANYGCGWKDVTLPASWQTQGFDFPIYSNIDLPWKAYGNATTGNAELVPAAPLVTNPVGFYRHRFDVDEDWLKDGKKVYISFKGVESAMYLYVNGHEVGYTEDSYDAHDFDITPFLNEDGKDNLLAVRVHRWCDGSWLEDQDCLRLGGIFRDVVLYATPAVHIRDYKVETDLDATFTDATLKLNLNVSNMSDIAAASFGVDVKLFDADGNNIVAADPIRADVPSIASGKEGTLAIERPIKAPHLWSDEDPYLYTMVISLYDKESGKHFESIAQQLGFREITFTMTEVDENYNKITEHYEQITINGKPLIFRGVNRHDVHPSTGRYISHELYETDLKLMKQNNINAVRTSHYPDDNYLYYLCDKYGLYVMAEANMETHALEGDIKQLENAPSDVMARNLELAYIDRVVANMKAQMNRTSVVMWSLGNECGITPETKMLQRSIQDVVRPLDITRPVNYERLYGEGGVDVYCDMYPGPDGITNKGQLDDNMPYFPIEYSHARGNASGFFKEFWDAIRAQDNVMGGFIWDWVDQSLATPLPEVEPIYNVHGDKSQNNFTGVITGEVKTDEEADMSYLSGYVVIPAANDEDALINEALSGTNSYSFEMYLRPNDGSTTSDPGIYQVLMKKGDNQTGIRAYNNNRIDFMARMTTNGSNRVNGTTQQFKRPSGWAGNWHHLMVTWDGVNHVSTAYVDGVKLATNNTTTIPDDAYIVKSSRDFAINYCTETGRIGNNDVAMARVYTKALTEAEVAAQRDAYMNGSDYVIEANDEDVLMWFDFNDTTVKEDTSTTIWDYYAEKGNEEWAGKYLAYGGDWGDVINQGSNCQNGLVSADRIPQAELQEVKYVQQSLWFTANQKQLAAGQVSLFNENQFIDTSLYNIRWELMEDGKVIDSGDAASAVAPGETAPVYIPFNMPKTPKADGEYFLNLYATLKTATAWAEAGHVAAYEQLPIAADIAHVAGIDAATIPTMAVGVNEEALLFTGENFSLTIDKTTGLLKNYTVGGKLLMREGPRPNYWRPMTESDKFTNEWADARRKMRVETFDVAVSPDDRSCKVTVIWDLPTAKNSKQTMIYTVYGTGAIRVESKLEAAAGLGELLKFGAELTLPQGFEQMTWYGEGPDETLVDRRQGATVGLYKSTVSDSFYPYLLPQLSGNHTGVRYIALEDPTLDTGLLVVGEKELEASALHYTIDDYANAEHPYEMPFTDYTILNIDQVSRGVGQESLGPPLPGEYRLEADSDLHYAYTILPYATATDDPMEMSKVWRDVEPVDDPTDLSGYESQTIATFSNMLKTYTATKDTNLKQLYADWTVLDGGIPLDLTAYDPENLRLRLTLDLHASDESVPASALYADGWVKLRSPDLVGKEGDSDPTNHEHNFGWNINASWNLHYGENVFDIPLKDALDGLYKNDNNTMYGANNRRGLMDWTEVYRLICVVNTPVLGDANSPYIDQVLTMKVKSAAIVDATFEAKLAQLKDTLADPADKGDATDKAYAAYEAAVDRGQAVADDERATLPEVEDALAQIAAAEEELTAEVVKGFLRMAIGDGELLDTTYWPEDKTATLQEALTAAKAVLNDDAATQAQVDEAESAMLDTLAELLGIERITLGDVNGNGNVTAEDALMALQAATQKITLNDKQVKAADVDGQGGVTANDALAILQYATKKISSF